jgi:predicted lipoprotein with Yx(FWY)xxD motif
LPVFTYVTERAITEAYDIRTTNITPFKTVIGQGYSTEINVTVTNQGDFTETFKLTVYTNTTAIDTKEITLTSQSAKNVTFTWNTTGLPKGKYSISAIAEPILGEVNTADNTFEYYWVKVKMPGNINGDSMVNFLDAILLGAAFGSAPGGIDWNSNADINCDVYVNFLDAIILGTNFGLSDP